MPTLTAETTSGSVRGQAHRGSTRFLGIPYAAPPVGERRFRPPVRADRWHGVRDCGEHGPICPQFILPEGMSSLPDMSGRGFAQSEDCLNLNVYTPAVDDGRRPTAVWIHGGAFVGGSSACPIYDGARFANDGVVFVSINYRLHAFGFLHLDGLFDAPGAGNCGLLDQVAALEWVRDNVAAFGGDPENVTVFGESAGAMSAATLLAVPAARGLFRRVAAFSGAGHHNLRPASAERVARRVLDRVGVAPGDRDALVQVPTDALTGVGQQIAFMEAEDLMGGEHAGVRTVFAPVIDGSIVPVRAIDAIADGSSDGIDVLVGTCADEYRVFIWGLPAPLRNLISVPDAAAYFRDADRDVGEVLEAYSAGRPGADGTDLAAAVAGDAVFGIPAIRLAEAKTARGDRVWMQQLAWPTPVLDGTLRACHALDVPFLFGDLEYPGFLGDDPPVALADDLHGACVRFIRDGDPNGGRLPRWPCYDTRNRPVMVLDREPTLVNDPGAAERACWEGVW